MKLINLLATSVLLISFWDESQGQPQEKPVPSDLYLGLFNNEPAQDFRIFVRDNYQHSCTDFPSAPNAEGLSEECKYYGDCCRDPMRIRERLEPGTFTCQTLPSFGSATFYLVNKCPTQTKDLQLSTLCENDESSPFPLTSNWLITSSRSGVTYKNIFCAICHGALDLTDFGDALTNQTTVEFWWSYIKCVSSTTVEELVKRRDESDRHGWLAAFNASLESGNCSYSFTPSLGVVPHRCLPAVRTCSSDYSDTEIIELCEGAPVDYRQGSDGNLYRNRFCVICNGLTSNAEVVGVVPFFQPTTSTTEPPRVTEITSTDRLLVKLKPQLQLENKLELSLNDRKINLTNEATTSFLSMTNNLSQRYAYLQTNTIPVPNTFWDLGSIWCDSSYDGICDALMKLPDMGCAGPGCGAGKWQNLDGQCSKLTDYIYEPIVRDSFSFVWPESLYGRYYSTCNAQVQIEYQRNCQCDVRCHYFGECCFDVPEIGVDLPPASRLEYTCMPLDSNSREVGYAVVSSCPSETDQVTADLCNAGVSGTWSPLGWPVYDPATTLSYKNVHCAACNNVNTTLIKYWIALMDCPWAPAVVLEESSWGNYCDFRNYKNPVSQDAYWCYQPEPIVSSCPSEFSNWKISTECEESITSWIYRNSTIYRNAFCAICNLGDEILSANVEYITTIGKLQQIFTRFLTYSLDVAKDDFIGLVEVDPTTDTCCYLGTCNSASSDLWGEISVNEQCQNLPFNISCGDSRTWSQIFQSSNISNQFLCSMLPPPQLPPPSFQPFGSLNPPTSIPDPPSYAEFFFSDVGDIPDQIVLSSPWEVILGSVSICSNSSLIDDEHDAYSRFKLTSSGIQAKDIVAQTNYAITLKVYDYILISLSLLFILCYIIWMVVTWKKTTRTKLMMLTLLISQFLSLVFFSISAVPIGDNIICKIIAALDQFFFLTTLTWTNALAIDITYTIYRIASSKSRRRYFAYSIYAFGLPLVLVLVTLGLFLEQDNLQLNSPVYRVDNLCFILNNVVLYSLYLIPLYVLIVANIALCIASIVRVTRRVEISSNDKDRTKKNVITCIKLTICLGVGWVLVFFELFGIDIWPVVLIFVELQGVLLVSANILGWECVKKLRTLSTSTLTTTGKGSATPISTELTSLAMNRLCTPGNTPKSSPAITPKGSPLLQKRTH